MVKAFIEESIDEDPMVIQAGVWILTDNYSSEQIKTHLRYTDEKTGEVRYPITDAHINKANEIIKRAMKEEFNRQRDFLSVVIKDKVISHKKISYKGGTFEGECYNDEPHGKGKWVGNDGGSYEGQMRFREMHGFGVIVFADGGKYEGEFIKGAYHGKGILTLRSGLIYEGQFEKGDPTGGYITYPDGRKTYTSGKF